MTVRRISSRTRLTVFVPQGNQKAPNPQERTGDLNLLTYVSIVANIIIKVNSDNMMYGCYNKGKQKLHYTSLQSVGFVVK